MRPEEAMTMPLTQDTQDPYCIRDAEGARVAAARLMTSDAAALVTMCNAYPLALALAEAAESMLAVLRPLTHEQETALQAALSAFLAHRTEGAKP